MAIRADEARGWVYRRILDHIVDPDVRQLAQLGLVVRRLTPDVILSILAGPAGVDVPDHERAQTLFERWSQEDQLLERLWDGSLAHRQDVRYAILPLLQRENPGQVRAVHSRAVAYYKARDDVPSRAEELYHRLCLGNSPRLLSQRWQDAVAPYLESALDELPIDSRVFLASRLDIDLSAVLDEASLREYERRSGTRVR
jgi:hypothetical protein